MTQRPEQDLQRLLAEEPFVRELARQLVAEDADEVVQQTWLQALAHGGRDVTQPRHWLARIARNAAANLRRGERRRAQRERSAAAHELVPSSAELAEREERRRALVAAVDALPQHLRTVVILRWFEGLPPRRIARDLGVPAATVSTQLQRALELLRQRLDEAHGGDRRAWLLPLVPFAARPLPLPHAPTSPWLLGGTIAMTTKNLFAAGAIALVALATVLLWPRVDAAAPRSERDALAPAVADAHPAIAVTSAVDEPTPVRETLAAGNSTSPATTGTVFAHLAFADHTPAVDRIATLTRVGDEARFDGRRQRTDETGTARFDAVAPGAYTVVGKTIEVAAGQTVEVAYEYRPGLALAGIVLDTARRPVAGAAIEVGWMDAYPEVLALSGADGRFEVRAAPDLCVVGARAQGHTASSVRFLYGKSGNAAAVELVVGDGGGSIEGNVIDPDGRPVANATVVVGNGELAGVRGREQIPPFPALARSDAAGHFFATGIPAGEVPVRVRSRNRAPWQGTCAIPAGGTASQQVVLTAGATIRGTVRDANRAPAADVEVTVGNWRDDLAFFSTRTDTDGSFELRSLPGGDVALRAWQRELGLAEPTVHTELGSTATCDVTLSRGIELRVRTLDEDGQPVPGVYLNCSGGGMANPVKPSDVHGCVTIINCPVTGTLAITASGEVVETLRKTDVDPRAGEIELRLRRAAPRAHIVGTIVGPDGRPVVNASASANAEHAVTGSGIVVTGNNGRFELTVDQPGRNRVSIRSGDLPDFESEYRDVAPGTTWDLGTITLPRGGVAIVRIDGTPLAGAWMRVCGIDGRCSWQVGEQAGRLCTKRLAPGDYLLCVHGDGVAAQAVPFAIRDGEDTVVDVTMSPGVTQDLAISVPPTTATGPWLPVTIHRLPQQTLATIKSIARKPEHSSTTTSLCLAPGS